MADVKVVVIYPRPKDAAVFEKVYEREHVPIAVPKLDAKKILVNSVLPGATDTEGFRAMPGSSDFRSVVVSQTPLGRLGQPQDIVNVVSFLAGDEAAWITGQLIAVSGGWN